MKSHLHVVTIFACSLGCTRVGNGDARLGRSFSRQEENPATVLDWITVSDPEVALSDDTDGISAPLLDDQWL